MIEIDAEIWTINGSGMGAMVDIMSQGATVIETATTVITSNTVALCRVQH
jgi:hypothetical protein